MTLESIDSTTPWDQRLERFDRAAVVRAVVTCIEAIVDGKNRASHALSARVQAAPLRIKRLTVSSFLHAQGGDALNRAYSRLKRLGREAELGALEDSTLNTFARICEQSTDAPALDSLRSAMAAYRASRRFEAAITGAAELRLRLARQLSVLKLRPTDLADLDALDRVVRLLILDPMARGRSSSVTEGYRMLYASVRTDRREYSRTDTEWHRMLEHIMGAGLTAHVRIGDNYHHTIANHLALLARDYQSATLRARIHAARHTQNLVSDESLRALTFMPPPTSKRLTDGLSRVYTYAAETMIHRGADLSTEMPDIDYTLTVDEAIRGAMDIELRVNNYDGAMRYRTNIVRCHIFRGRLDEAQREIDAIRAELVRSGREWPFVQIQVLLDESVLWYQDADRSGKPNSRMHRAALEKLEHAEKQASKLGAPLMWRAHQVQYEKWMPPIGELDLA